MPKVFNFYPKTVYSLSDNNSLNIITNLTTNFSFLTDLSQYSSSYYEYTISESDTPENLAHKIYGNSEYHWIILKFNNIMDVKNDWPITYNQLIDSINVAYSTSEYADTANTANTGLQWAKSNIHSYYKIQTKTVLNSNIIEVDKIRIDSNTYANLTPDINPTIYELSDNNKFSIITTKENKTYYEYEIEANEEKRNIKILRNEFIPTIENEFRKIMSENV